MEFFNRLHSIEFVRRLSTRIREVSRSFAQKPIALRLIRHRHRALGAALVLTSAAIGIWAHDLAQAEALGGWLRAHPPSPLIWKHALESRHYKTVPEDKLLQRASRTLPSLIDEENSVWVSSDQNWIAIYAPKSEEMTSSLYCLDCEQLPMGWQPAGKGWEAFDPLLGKIDVAALSRIKTKPENAERPDPLEIRY